MKPVLAAALFAIAMLGGSPAARAEAARTPTVHYHLRVLPNGLKVYSVVDRTTPNVTIQVWYNVGAKDDPAGRSGFAHLFEHLMFKGARDMPAEYMSRLTEDVGGLANASTDNDFTEYHEVVPAGHLERLLWAEAERMSSLVVGQADFISERAVVEQELRQRVLADPYGPLFALDIPAASFTVHPYQRSPIGSIADLEAATLSDVKAFHALYYRPDNANLIVVGNFDPERLDAAIDRYFAPIPRPKPPIPRVTTVEPARTTARTVDVYSPDVPAPAVVLTYAAPNAASNDSAALNVLDAILTTGKGSRLYASLVYRQQLAAQVFSDVDLSQQAGLFDVGVILAAGKTLDQGEAALRAEIAQLREHAVTDAELRTAKNQLMAEALQNRETIDGLASEIGQAIVVEGDAAHINTDVPALQAVTAADIQRVAQTYLADERRVTIHYRAANRQAARLEDRPPAGKISRATAWPGRRPIQVAEAPAASSGLGRMAPVPVPAPGPAPGAPLPMVLPRPVERTLSNGLRVIVARTGDLPLVTALLTVKAGSALDPPGAAGLTALTVTLAPQGAAGRSAVQIATAIEALGDTLSTQVDYDSSTIGLTGLSTSLSDALPVLADIVRRPTFDDAELRRLRRQDLEGLSLSMREPGEVADFAVAPLVFGKGPYGHAMTGLPRSLARMTRDAVVRQHQRLYRPDHAILVLTGDVEPDAAFALAERAFGDWVDPPRTPTRPTPDEPAPKGRTIMIDLPGADQATITLAARSIGRLDPSYYAVEVANSVLGGGYSSRLNTEVRVRRGLSYDASSTVDELRGTGLFTATTQTRNGSAAQVADLMLGQVKALGRQPPTAEELAARKAALIGAFGRDAETSSDVADLLAEEAVYGIGLDEFARLPQRIEAITAGQMQTAAARLADPARIDIIVVGDARQALPALKSRFARIEVIPIGALKLTSPSLR